MSIAGDHAGALLVLSREQGGSRDIFRAYHIVIDGGTVGKIRRGRRLELPITAGHHEIFLRIDWCRSPTVEVGAQPGDVIHLSCRPGGTVTSGFRDAAGGAESYIELARIFP